ncbi:hypothetical protein M413DRAFT_21362 [Hebeloma cylindrosporum]|uniref:Uncharacterized protein n=1 Tax=Hebeloma cylindrosporum TaxID=76867 RepID=A0A0C3CY41_HEBCY|nr:hypothetical protein M413DRAFT_21362 [Hebeloma cylindrosporum h7]
MFPGMRRNGMQPESGCRRVTLANVPLSTTTTTIVTAVARECPPWAKRGLRPSRHVATTTATTTTTTDPRHVTNDDNRGRPTPLPSLRDPPSTSPRRRHRRRRLAVVIVAVVTIATSSHHHPRHVIVTSHRIQSTRRTCREDDGGRGRTREETRRTREETRRTREETTEDEGGDEEDEGGDEEDEEDEGGRGRTREDEATTGRLVRPRFPPGGVRTAERGGVEPTRCLVRRRFAPASLTNTLHTRQRVIPRCLVSFLPFPPKPNEDGVKPTCRLVRLYSLPARPRRRENPRVVSFGITPHQSTAADVAGTSSAVAVRPPPANPTTWRETNPLTTSFDGGGKSTRRLVSSHLLSESTPNCCHVINVH